MSPHPQVSSHEEVIAKRSSQIAQARLRLLLVDCHSRLLNGQSPKLAGRELDSLPIELHDKATQQRPGCSVLTEGVSRRFENNRLVFPPTHPAANRSVLEGLRLEGIPQGQSSPGKRQPLPPDFISMYLIWLIKSQDESEGRQGRLQMSPRIRQVMSLSETIST